jgi:hypothetical protein
MYTESTVMGAEEIMRPGRSLSGIYAAIAGICLCVLAACATTSLSPGPGAATVPGEADTVINRIDGVSVTVETNAWQGSRVVTNAVEPIRVTITNQGSSPIRLRYSDFALVDADGRRYAALPPYQVEGTLLNPVLADGYAVIVMPGFRFRGFYVAPYYSRIYPNIPVHPRRYYLYDPFYYNYYYADLRSTIRPTMEMLNFALPEGIIDAGGSVSGFLYFQQVRPGTESVTLRGTLVSLGTSDSSPGGAIFGEISIPYTVTTLR